MLKSLFPTSSSTTGSTASSVCYLSLLSSVRLYDKITAKTGLAIVCQVYFSNWYLHQSSNRSIKRSSSLVTTKYVRIKQARMMDEVRSVLSPVEELRLISISMLIWMVGAEEWWIMDRGCCEDCVVDMDSSVCQSIGRWSFFFFDQWLDLGAGLGLWLWLWYVKERTRKTNVYRVGIPSAKKFKCDVFLYKCFYVSVLFMFCVCILFGEREVVSWWALYWSRYWHAMEWFTGYPS